MDQPLQLVTRERHANKKWNRSRGYSFAAKTNVVPIAAAELSQAVRSLPLAFLESEGRQTLVALLGLLPGQNLFVAPDGRWLGLYVPASLRAYPFRLGRTDKQDNYAMVVDESSGLVTDLGVGEDGVSFFNEEGKPAEETQKVLDFLIKTKRSGDACARAVDALQRHELIETWPLKVKDGEAEKSIAGVGRISESKLNALEPEAMVELRDAGGLALAFGQLFSMSNISVLTTLAQAHAKASAAQAKRMEIPENSFVGEEDDNLKIDWNQFLKDR
ncbi:SapC [Devosia pacifica]|uniref:SapC n=1 Tax=Devosia pacifica TaxID=1335967 RepID=A0A918SAE5_9HYPH|nr:SapC family protein [Devosia pacifica]GHA32661.1 SapC [Devosia pacifica]